MMKRARKRERKRRRNEREDRISGLMMMEMSFYLSAFRLFTTGRIVRMWMKKTVNEKIRKFRCHFFFLMMVQMVLVMSHGIIVRNKAMQCNHDSKRKVD